MTTPDITTPIISGVNDPTSLNPAYGVLAQLVGTWNSSPTQPTGYNVMPLPAGNVQNQPNPDNDDFLSKNFYYFEEMTFTAPGEAPNRGQLFQQGCYGLTYEQRVYFAADPKEPLGGLESMPPVPDSAANTLVHFENGLWLNLQYEAQPSTAYAPPGTKLPFPPSGASSAPEQPAAYKICKQISIPHGNSVLATGSVTSYDHAPRFDTSDPGAKPFNIAGDNIKNPTLVLAAQLAELAKQGITVTKTTELAVSTANPGGGTTNLQFEQGNADVTTYSTHLYIEELSNGTTQLQYVQTIKMVFDITTDPQGTPIPSGGTKEVFLHITANTLTRV